MVYDNAHKIFLKYGAQGVAADFAYTDKKYYTKRTPQQHAGIFAVGAAGGIMQGFLGKYVPSFINEEKGWLMSLNYFVQSSFFYGIEFVGSAVVKADDKGLYTKGWQTKMGVSGYKALVESLKRF